MGMTYLPPVRRLSAKMAIAHFLACPCHVSFTCGELSARTPMLKRVSAVRPWQVGRNFKLCTRPQSQMTFNPGGRVGVSSLFGNLRTPNTDMYLILLDRRRHNLCNNGARPPQQLPDFCDAALPLSYVNPVS